MKYCFLAAFYLVTTSAICQVHVDPSLSQITIHPAAVQGAEWHPGHIILNDGKKLEGGVHFDPVLDLVYLKNGEQLISLSPKNTSEFEFEKARFVSLPYDEHNNGFIKTFFFRLIEENEYFLILERVSSIKVKRYSWDYLPSTTLAYLKNVQSIYLGLNDQGKIIKLGKNTKENKKFLKEIYQDDFMLINRFMKENDWKYKDLKGIIDALNYYYSYHQ